MKFPLLVTLIGTDCSAPDTPRVVICGWYVAPKTLPQQTVTAVVLVGTPFVLNQLTPSWARSNRRVYPPPFGGDCTCAWTATDCPCSRSAGRRVRRPSHTMSAPAWSYQW